MAGVCDGLNKVISSLLFVLLLTRSLMYFRLVGNRQRFSLLKRKAVRLADALLCAHQISISFLPRCCHQERRTDPPQWNQFDRAISGCSHCGKVRLCLWCTNSSFLLARAAFDHAQKGKAVSCVVSDADVVNAMTLFLDHHRMLVLQQPSIISFPTHSSSFRPSPLVPPHSPLCTTSGKSSSRFTLAQWWWSSAAAAWSRSPIFSDGNNSLSNTSSPHHDLVFALLI